MSMAIENNNLDYMGICLSSGGIKGIIMLGSLNYYYDKKTLDNVKYYSGTSAGSIIAMLLAVGYSPMEILGFTCSDEITRQLSNFNIMNITNIHGIYHNSILKNFIDEKIRIKLEGKSPTFYEYYKQYGKYLLIPVYCISEPVENRKVYCSPDETPDMKIIDAISLSCNIPIIFQKAIYKNKVYIDGAYTSHFPLEALKERIGYNENNEDYKILGINIKNKQYNTDNLLDYILAIQNIPLVEQPSNFDSDINTDVIHLECPKDISVINFNLSSSRKSDLFNDGYFQAKKLFEKSKDN
jgi:NTE family protein